MRDLRLLISLASRSTYLIADPPRLRALGDLITLAISLVTALRVWQVFPFAFHGSMAFSAPIVRILLALGVAGTCIGLLYSLVTLLKGRPGVLGN